MKRRLLPILMTLVLVCALPIWAAFQTVEKVQPVLGFFHNLCYNNPG